MVLAAFQPGLALCRSSIAVLSQIHHSLTSQVVDVVGHRHSHVTTPEIKSRYFKEEKVIGNILHDTDIMDKSMKLRNRLKVLWWCKQQGLRPKAISKQLK